MANHHCRPQPAALRLLAHPSRRRPVREIVERWAGKVNRLIDSFRRVMKRPIQMLASLMLAVSTNAHASLTFVEAQVIPNCHGNDVLLVDCSGNGHPDAIVANGSADKPLPSKLWINDGSGHFRDSGQDLGCAKSWSISCGRTHRGGATDLFIANGDWNHGDASHLWINDGQGRFNRSSVIFDTANTSCAVLGDLNGGGVMDLFVANHPYADGHGGGCEVWLNNGDGGFINTGQHLAPISAPRRVKLVDVDGDGSLDAIVLNAAGQDNAIFINDGKGHFTKSPENIGQGENIDVAVGDIDNDGKADLVIAKGAWGKTPKGIEVWHNEGNGHFVRRQCLGTNDVYGVAMADLNGNGYVDIVAVCGPDQPNQIFLNNGKGFFVDAKVDIGKGGNKVAIADLNHDNLPDLLIVGDDCARVLLQFRP